MNIALLNRTYWKDGAISSIVRTSAKWFLKKGDKVTVIASDVNAEDLDDKCLFARASSSKVRIFDFSGIIFAFTSFFRLVSIHKKHPIDGMIVHDSTGFYGAYLFSRVYKIPAIVFFHGWIYNPIREKAYQRTVTYMYKLNARFCAKNAYKIGCISQEIFDGMKWLGATDERVELFPNAIDLDRFKVQKEIKRLKKEKTVLFVGRLETEKGIKYLIEAIPEILSKVVTAKFIIIGKGSQEKMLKEVSKELHVDENIDFKGHIPNNQIVNYYADADLLTIPSLSEGHALVPLEAIACGTPVVGTRIDGITETVVDGYNGLLVKPEDHMELAKAIVKVLSNDELLMELTSNTRPSVQKFSWEHSVDRLRQILLN